MMTRAVKMTQETLKKKYLLKRKIVCSLRTMPSPREPLKWCGPTEPPMSPPSSLKLTPPRLIHPQRKAVPEEKVLKRYHPMRKTLRKTTIPGEPPRCGPMELQTTGTAARMSAMRWRASMSINPCLFPPPQIKTENVRKCRKWETSRKRSWVLRRKPKGMISSSSE